MGRKHRLNVLIFPYFAAILKRQVSPSAAFEVKGGVHSPPGEITLIYPTVESLSVLRYKYKIIRNDTNGSCVSIYKPDR